MKSRKCFLTFLNFVIWRAFFLPSISLALQASRSNMFKTRRSDANERGLNTQTNRTECVMATQTFNPKIHKSKYRVGVQAVRGYAKAFEEYNLTFAEYLTATAGQRFDPPIEFEMVPESYEIIFDEVLNETIDFMFVDPGVYSCVGVELGAQAVSTVIYRHDIRDNTFDLDLMAGVIFAKNDRDDIENLQDLKDKIVAAGSISMIASGQLQFFEMQQAGLSYVTDPKQVVFTHDKDDIVRGVLNGDFDVGFIQTGQIERALDDNGNQIDPSVFKIISPQMYVMDDGNYFPFHHSTDVFPEWVVAALSHVHPSVVDEVQDALQEFQNHAKTGQLLKDCAISNPVDIDCVNIYESNCDTTNQLAELALSASQKVDMVGFRAPRSYFSVRSMQEEEKFLEKDTEGLWRCKRADNLYDAIVCPEGTYELTEEEFSHSCSDAGLTCQEGYSCFCKPCVKAFDVDVYQYHLKGKDLKHHEGCSKMSVCGSTEQTREISIRILDNLRREGAKVTALIHLGRNELLVEAQKVEDKPWMYEILWTSNTVGMAVLEVFVNDEQIPESPIRVEIVERDCELDYPGAEKVASSSGECICGSSYIDFSGKCVSSTVIAVVASVFAFLVIAHAAFFYVRYRNHQNDKLWQVNLDDLNFDDPVEIIGQGSFGVVLLAEYRGTKVAIKRALKSTEKTGSSKSKKSLVKKSTNYDSRDSLYSCDNSSLEEGSKITQDVISDLESPSSDGIGNKSVGAYGKSRRASEQLSFGFLGEDYRKKTKWGWLFPWNRGAHDYQTRFKESILGESASMSKKSFGARLFPWCNAEARKQEEFIQEMRVLARLRHPCITTVMGAVVSSKHDPMLVMEYMEYGSLHDLLRNETMYLNGEIILQILRDIAQGLRYLHTSRPPILHGDLKARNILIDAKFRAKLCDFGMSTKQTNYITGTPYWLAPEYLRGQSEYTTHCDMYSMGIIFYEIYSRKNPYEGENFIEVLRAVCNRRINKRPAIPETTPPKMVDLMKKCWSPDIFVRPQAKDLDTAMMQMNSYDADHLEDGKQQIRATNKTGDMMYELFPKHVADALKAGEKVEPESHELVTVVFSDIVHFTDISRELSALKVSQMLDRLYLAFDKIARQHQVFKVETIGDAYMGVTNLEGNQEHTHVKQIAEFAVDMINEANKILIDEEDPSRGNISIRVGFHSGNVVTNVIGSLNKRFGLFGDTVNTASRMESNSQENRILCSERSHNLLKIQARDFPTRKRGKINVKGKGEMTVYWVGLKLITAGKSNKGHGNEKQAVTFQEGPLDADETTVHKDDPPFEV